MLARDREMDLSPYEPPPRVTTGIDRLVLWLVVTPVLLGLLYVIFNIVAAALGADDY